MPITGACPEYQGVQFADCYDHSHVFNVATTWTEWTGTDLDFVLTRPGKIFINYTFYAYRSGGSSVRVCAAVHQDGVATAGRQEHDYEGSVIRESTSVIYVTEELPANSYDFDLRLYLYAAGDIRAYRCWGQGWVVYSA